MRFGRPRKTCFLVLILSLFGQALGLAACGDVDCLQEGSNVDCTVLVCDLFAGHSGRERASDDGLDSICPCFCHLLVDLPSISHHVAPTAAVPHRTIEVGHPFSEPLHRIDHPPQA